MCVLYTDVGLGQQSGFMVSLLRFELIFAGTILTTIYENPFPIGYDTHYLKSNLFKSKLYLIYPFVQ